LQRAAVQVVRVETLRHGAGDDEARAAHQVARVAVVDLAVVAEEMEQTTTGVDGPREVERHRVAHVGAQEIG